MGHNKYTDTCVICGYGFNAQEDENPMRAIAGRMRPVCPDCRGKLQVASPPYLFKVKVFSTGSRQDLIDTWLTTDAIFNSNITEDEGVEITIVYP